MASSNDNGQSPALPEQLGIAITNVLQEQLYNDTESMSQSAASTDQEVPADLDSLILPNIDNQSADTIVDSTHMLSEPSLEATAASDINAFKEFESNLSSTCNEINTSMRTHVVEVFMDGNNTAVSMPPTPTGQLQTRTSTISDYDQRVQSISERHIMISYHHDSSYTIAERLCTQLRRIGYNLWMDRNDLHGSIHEGMAGAVENSFVVLFCINHEYFESEFCEKEVKYTDKIHMNFVPCLLEAGYEPRSWLGIIIRDQLYIDFSSSDNFDTGFEELIAEIKAVENRLQISHVATPILHPVENTQNIEVMSTSTTIACASNQAQHGCLRSVIRNFRESINQNNDDAQPMTEQELSQLFSYIRQQLFPNISPLSPVETNNSREILHELVEHSRSQTELLRTIVQILSNLTNSRTITKLSLLVAFIWTVNKFCKYR